MRLPRLLAFVYLSAALVAALPGTTSAAAPATTADTPEDCASQKCPPCDPLQDTGPSKEPFTPLPPNFRKASAKSKDPPNAAAAKDANKPAAPKKGPAPRDIKAGWFSNPECQYLIQESEKGVNYWHLMDALWEIRNVLTKYGVKWAVGGGLALKLHGMQRYTTDVDMIVDADMQHLRGMFTNNDLFLVPGNWWPLQGPHLRVFFRYQRYMGAKADPKAPRYIEVDLIISGTLTTPRDLITNSIDIAKETKDGRKINVHTMRLGKIFKSKLYALDTPRRVDKQPKDIADANWILTEKPGALKHAATDIEIGPRDNYCNLLLNLNGITPMVRNAEKYLGIEPAILVSRVSVSN